MHIHQVPAWCLTSLYKNSTADELRMGKERLRQNCEKQGSTKRVLLNQNVSTFIDCFEAIAQVDKMLRPAREDDNSAQEVCG